MRRSLSTVWVPPKCHLVERKRKPGRGVWTLFPDLFRQAERWRKEGKCTLRGKCTPTHPKKETFHFLSARWNVSGKKHFFPFLVNHVFHFWDDIERLCGDHFRPPGFRQSATPRKESGSPVEGPERFFRKRSARRKDGGKKANVHYAVNVRLPMSPDRPPPIDHHVAPESVVACCISALRWARPLKTSTSDTWPFDRQRRPLASFLDDLVRCSKSNPPGAGMRRARTLTWRLRGVRAAPRLRCNGSTMRNHETATILSAQPAAC